MRVRVGEIVAECAAGDAERLGLRRGERVWLRFAPGDARLVDAHEP